MYVKMLCKNVIGFNKPRKIVLESLERLYKNFYDSLESYVYFIYKRFLGLFTNREKKKKKTTNKEVHDPTLK